MRGLVRRSGLTLTLLALPLCVGCTTVSADLPPPRECSRYVGPFLTPTPHAPPPTDDSSKEWVGFGVAEAGQLELSNRDKTLAGQVLTVCEAETQEAFDRAARRVKPWYRRIF